MGGRLCSSLLAKGSGNCVMGSRFLGTIKGWDGIIVRVMRFQPSRACCREGGSAAAGRERRRCNPCKRRSRVL